ncbi:DUF2997 domain-containing protein [Sinomonas mesophila]|uniref:DUF2997 domain-containing protein n=1 Tax=Sinomonas mesophila TaxID=1531955 RepID=UPI00098780C8
MTRRITVNVGPDGVITAGVSGAPGPSCLSSYETINQLVPGTTVVDSRLTDEYHVQMSESATVQNQIVDHKRLP